MLGCFLQHYDCSYILLDAPCGKEESKEGKKGTFGCTLENDRRGLALMYMVEMDLITNCCKQWKAMLKCCVLEDCIILVSC